MRLYLFVCVLGILEKQKKREDIINQLYSVDYKANDVFFRP